MGDDASNDEKTPDASDGRSVPERVTFGASLALVLALVGFLAYHGLATARATDKEATPMASVAVKPEHARRSGDRWAIPVHVENVGNVALEDVQAQVTLRGADGKPRDVDLSFPYLPEQGAEDAYVVSEVPPDKARPEARVVSFHTQRDARGY